LHLGAAGRGVGKDKASAEVKREAGDFQRVAARRDVIPSFGG
jgi:hypothetical protein